MSNDPVTPTVVGSSAAPVTTTRLKAFFRFYNEHRPHSAHDHAGQHFTPMEVYRRDLAQPLSA